MRIIQKLLFLWLQQGVYSRLFLPLLLMIIVSGSVRYHMLINAERNDAQQRAGIELRQAEHRLTPQLLALDCDAAAIARLLTQELAAASELGSLTWQACGSSFTRQQTAVVSKVPAWFLDFLAFRAVTLKKSSAQADGSLVSLSLSSSATTRLEQIWYRVKTQVIVSAWMVLFIYLLLILILRSNAKTLAQLARANLRFQHGEHSVRLHVGGTSEGRALASTFNHMATEIERLLATLRESQHKQSEQLHFTWELLTVLPIPIFFQDHHGICRGVNPAWVRMFGLSTQQVIGQPMREVATALMPLAAPHVVAELSLPGPGQDLAVLFYQAAYTNVDGQAAGHIGALVDISERKQIEADLAAEKERLDTTLDSIGDAVISTDQYGHILTLNRVAQQLTGWSQAEACGLPLSSVFELSEPLHGAQLALFLLHIGRQTANLDARNLALQSRSGKLLDIDYTAAPIRQSAGENSGCVLIFRDLSETRHLQRQISWQAGHDVLTGLANRSALHDELASAISEAQDQQHVLAVCLLDLDHFQAINEQYGHEFADQLLQAVALRLQHSVGHSNPLARLGGDEFVVLLKNQHDTAAIDSNLSALLRDLAQPYLIGQRQAHLTASIGVAVYPHDELSPDALLRYADQALYQAKISGRNKYHLFDARLDQEVRTRHDQLARIRSALRDGEFVLYFQPKVDMRQACVIGMEALLRWNHPERGLVGPLEFLPLIEQTELIIDIGLWVLRSALRQLSDWLAAGQTWVISVNIAARHFQSGDFLSSLRSILAEFPDIAPHYLEIEILESAAIDDIEYVREVMITCQQLGVRFALDDFGTGYSSLSYLKRLPANTLKIDQSFVRNMLEDRDDLALIGAIVGLAQAFKREVIAEGVETSAHGAALMQLGCDQAQGFGIARPMPAADVQQWAAHYVVPAQWQANVAVAAAAQA